MPCGPAQAAAGNFIKQATVMQATVMQATVMQATVMQAAGNFMMQAAVTISARGGADGGLDGPRAPGASTRLRAEAQASARGASRSSSRRFTGARGACCIHGAEAGFRPDRPVDPAEALAAIHGAAAAQGCSNRAESRRRASRLDDLAKCAPRRLGALAIRRLGNS